MPLPDHWKHNRPKPVIGLVGGVGAGKSTIAGLFASQGCAVIDSDALAHEVLDVPDTKNQLRAWLGPNVFHPDGSVNRKVFGPLVLGDESQMKRLNQLIHPRVAQSREHLMAQYLSNPAIPAIVWDTPLLLETELDRECDVVVFIKTPDDKRLQRVTQDRGWTPLQWSKREKLQFPLDKKADVADYCIDNSGDRASSLRQVQQVLSHLLQKRS